MLTGISIGCLIFLALMKACTFFMKAVGDDLSLNLYVNMALYVI